MRAHTCRLQVTCRECGVLKSIDEYRQETRERLHRDSLCFDCAHWTDRHARQLVDPRAIVVDGLAYSLGPEPAPTERKSWRLGCGGQRWTLRPIEGGPDVVSHNVWCQGVVPPHFRERMPDTHKEVPQP